MQQFIPDPLPVPGNVARNISSSLWETIITNSDLVSGPMLFTPPIPWAGIQTRVPASFPNAFVLDPETGEPTEERKRWWNYTMVFLDRPSTDSPTQGILRVNGNLQNVTIENDRLTKGHFPKACTDELLRLYVNLSPAPLLSARDGFSQIRAWKEAYEA